MDVVHGSFLSLLSFARSFIITKKPQAFWKVTRKTVDGTETGGREGENENIASGLGRSAV